MNTKEMVAVMQHYVNGGDIQECQKDGTDKKNWTDFIRCPTDSPRWNWTHYDYRIKPREPREFWLLLGRDDIEILDTQPEYERESYVHVREVL